MNQFKESTHPSSTSPIQPQPSSNNRHRLCPDYKISAWQRSNRLSLLLAFLACYQKPQTLTSCRKKRKRIASGTICSSILRSPKQT